MGEISRIGCSTMNRGHNSLNYFTDTLKSKIWKKKTVTLTDYDPVYKVIYLGNVLTPWAKGDGCVDKPLATLWKNYCSNVKHEIFMKVTICASGIKAITREHGLTEYWANRITYCYAHPDYPKVFCWIYRHEAKKLKQELRCHAVLCSKETKAVEMCRILSNKLVIALQEFRREKRMRQNSRLLQSHFLKHPHLKSLDHYSLDSHSITLDGHEPGDEEDGSSCGHRDECDCANTDHHANTNGSTTCNGGRGGSTSSSIDSSDSSNSWNGSAGVGGRRMRNGTIVGGSSSTTCTMNGGSSSTHITSSNNRTSSNCIIDGSCNVSSHLPGSSNFGGIPVRKRHLVRGQANFKPPLERSKSAPRLTSIDEEEECNNLSHLFQLL